jgi:hypothetical protein
MAPEEGLQVVALPAEGLWEGLREVAPGGELREVAPGEELREVAREEGLQVVALPAEVLAVAAQLL